MYLTFLCSEHSNCVLHTKNSRQVIVLDSLLKYLDINIEPLSCHTHTQDMFTLNICTHSLPEIVPVHVCRLLIMPQPYAGTVKLHNVANVMFATDTGFKQTERTIFLHIISKGLKV